MLYCTILYYTMLYHTVLDYTGIVIGEAGQVRLR